MTSGIRWSLLLLVLCVLGALALTASPHARSHPDRLRHLLTEDRSRGRQRDRASVESDGRARQQPGGLSGANVTQDHVFNEEEEEEEGDVEEEEIVEVALSFGGGGGAAGGGGGRSRGSRGPESGSEPSLLSKQTLGLAHRTRAHRRRHHHPQSGHTEGHDMALITGDPATASSGGASRKARRPIKGSQAAVVVTQMTYLKKDWCKTQPLKQVVRMKGCLRTKILNNFCYGQCNSFYIPKQARKDKDTEAFLSCGFCRPRRIRWILVTLKCPSPAGLRFKRKRVQYVKKCRCMAQDVNVTPFS